MSKEDRSKHVVTTNEVDAAKLKAEETAEAEGVKVEGGPSPSPDRPPGRFITTGDLSRNPEPSPPEPKRGGMVSTNQLYEGRPQGPLEQVIHPESPSGDRRTTAEVNLLSDVIRDEAWRGRPAFIVGGGPSLKGFDFEALRGELVIAVNRAFESIPWAAMAFSIDLRYYTWLLSGQLDENSLEKWRSFSGAKVWMLRKSEGFLDPTGLLVCRRDDEPNQVDHRTNACSIEHGFETPSDSGYAAVQLAIALGASPIYLLGFDMAGDGDGRQAWFHSGYPKVQEDGVYTNMYLPKWERLGTLAADAGAQVRNLNPESALKVFPTAKFKSLEPLELAEPWTAPGPMPLIVSFATRNTPYEDEAREMARSVQMFGALPYVESLETTGDWAQNCLMKAPFILRMAEDHGPVIWLDADARMQRYPFEFQEIEKGTDLIYFAVDWSEEDRPRDDTEINSSLLYASGSAACKKFLKRWADACAAEAHTKVWDQRVLQRLIEEEQANPKSKMTFATWPKGMIAVDRVLESPKNPLIRCNQASRKLRGQVALPMKGAGE